MEPIEIEEANIELDEEECEIDNDALSLIQMNDVKTNENRTGTLTSSEELNKIYEPLFNIVEGIKIYDGTTLATRHECSNMINYYKTLAIHGEKLFTDLIPSTLTGQGGFSNISFMEEDLIKLLKFEDDNIMKIHCNYGCLVHPMYKKIHEVEKKKKEEEKKKKLLTKVGKQGRKIQGDGSCFSSQITFYVRHPDLLSRGPPKEKKRKYKRAPKKNKETKNKDNDHEELKELKEETLEELKEEPAKELKEEKVKELKEESEVDMSLADEIYKVKLFRNGVFQVAGITNPEMTDLIKPINILRNYLQHYFPNKIEILCFTSVMRNYKIELLNKYYHIDLNQVEEIIKMEKENPKFMQVWNSFINILPKPCRSTFQNYLTVPNPLRIAEIGYNVEIRPSLNIKFYWPYTDVSSKKRTTIKILKKGKINLDSCISEFEVKKFYYFFEYLFNKYHNRILCDIRLINNNTDVDTSECSEDSIYDDD